MDDLRPFPCACPFCGSHKLKAESKSSPKKLNIKTKKWEKHYAVSLRCNKCHARGPVVSITLPYPSNALELLEDSAIEAWNVRAIVPDSTPLN